MNTSISGQGIAVCSVGHAHPRHHGHHHPAGGKRWGTRRNLYYTRPQGLLAAKIIELVGTEGPLLFLQQRSRSQRGLVQTGAALWKPDRVGRDGTRSSLSTSPFHGPGRLAGIAATGQEESSPGVSSR